ncbi:MAG: nicotinamide riboside transporter PnuC [Faecalibacterium sp.]|nr:nicotinamide riboside transporter PnuC [Ruminococcus sp.]MCM1391392.1 nicotinamide riboside transporter PnuC [Ruminococcus sp.]MCM1484602.1 nicotinamide riboside transporter PnuC [Faecalibacterium sp.]
MKKLLKSFTPYQITYLVVVFAITALFIIFMPDKMLDDVSNPLVVVCSVIATLANPICELLISKQSKWNFIVDVFFIELTEFIICIAMGWYTIAIVTLCFWIPIDIASYIKWTKNSDSEKEELTVVRRLTFKQDIFVILAILAFGFGGGYLMSLIPGAADSYLDALSAACGMANGILLLMRYNEQWYAWFMTCVLYVILYVTSGAYIMLITAVAMLVNTVYGFVKWLVYTKKHQALAQDANIGNK